MTAAGRPGTARGPKPRARGPSRHRLARVEQPERVERPLDAAQQVDADGPEALLEVLQLRDPDAVLARDRPAARERLVEDAIERPVHARDLVGIAVVDAA